jgi:hypothetical protein
VSADVGKDTEGQADSAIRRELGRESGPASERRFPFSALGHVLGDCQKAFQTVEHDEVRRIKSVDSLARAFSEAGDAIPDVALLANFFSHPEAFAGILPNPDIKYGAADEFAAQVSIPALERFVHIEEASLFDGGDGKKRWGSTGTLS